MRPVRQIGDASESRSAPARMLRQLRRAPALAVAAAGAPLTVAGSKSHEKKQHSFSRGQQVKHNAAPSSLKFSLSSFPLFRSIKHNGDKVPAKYVPSGIPLSFSPSLPDLHPPPSPSPHPQSHLSLPANASEMSLEVGASSISPLASYLSSLKLSCTRWKISYGPG